MTKLEEVGEQLNNARVWFVLGQEFVTVLRSCHVKTVSLSLLASQDGGIKVTAEEVMIARQTLGVSRADPSNGDSMSRGGWIVSQSCLSNLR
jgi:hypothetical protein